MSDINSIYAALDYIEEETKAKGIRLIKLDTTCRMIRQSCEVILRALDEGDYDEVNRLVKLIMLEVS